MPDRDPEQADAYTETTRTSFEWATPFGSVTATRHTEAAWTFPDDEPEEP